MVCVPFFSLAVMADDAVVFIGGDGDTYSDLKSAADALPAEGGIIVVRGAVKSSESNGIVLPAKPLVITSVHGGVDYSKTNGAYLGLGGDLTANSQLTIENITIKQTSAEGDVNIYAQGNAITLGNGIKTVENDVTSKYPSVFGGYPSTSAVMNNSAMVTVMSGTWQNVYGGSYTGIFHGNSAVIMTDGEVLSVISGGSRDGDQTGSTKLDISGGTVYAACGGIHGISDGLGSLTGDVEVDIHGSALVENNVFGVSYYDNILFNGNVDIDIYGSAQLCRHVYGGCLGTKGKTNITTGDKGIVITLRENVSFTRPSGSTNILAGGSCSSNVVGNVKVVIKDDVYYTGNVYAGGYEGKLDGNSTAEIYGGEVSVNFTAASRTGTVTGTATTLAYGGRIGYYLSNEFYNLLGTNSGTVGSAVVILDGADVAGKVALNGAKGTLTLKSGYAGSVPDKCTVDLTGGKELEIGTSMNVFGFTGDGTLTVPASGNVTADSFSGSVKFVISGAPIINQTYFTVADKNSSGDLSYTSADDEKLVKEVGDSGIAYTVKAENRYDTTKVRIYYYNPNANGAQPKAILKKGIFASGEAITAITEGKDNGKNYIEADLAQGLFSCKVYYGDGSSDYRIKYFYANGKNDKLTYDLPLDPFVKNSWSENVSSIPTDEVMKLFGTDGLIGYEKFDTPTFDIDNNVRTFMNNDALCAYVDALGEKCNYLYVYYPFNKTAMGNKVPVMIFTNDKISETSFDDAAKLIRAGGDREILMITGGVHGNEPAGSEGVLAFSKLLTGEYGKEVLKHFGAIVIMPSVSADNSQRFTRMTESGVNPNRDLMALLLESTQNQVYVYKSFMPTVTIDCHEDNGNPDIDKNDLSIENLDDICIRFSSMLNSPLYDVSALKNGSFDAVNSRGNKIMMDAIERTKSSGLRGSVYPHAYAYPVSSTNYPLLRGSYGYIVETMRIWTGIGRYERAVFGIQEALKALVAEIIEADGAVAKDVYENRKRVAAITDFDENNLFGLKHSESGAVKVTADRPTIYVSGVWKNTNGKKSFNIVDTLSNFIALPTAYVLDADISGIDNILKLLDLHGIPYTKLSDNATLTLRKYSGGYANTVIGSAESVTFKNGAYAVTLNNSDAYLIAYLFEPNSYPYSNAEETSISFAHLGYIKDGDGLYRSEQSGVASVIAQLNVNSGTADVTTDTSNVVGDTSDTAADTSDVSEPSTSDGSKTAVFTVSATLLVGVVICVAVVVFKKRASGKS